VTETGFAQVFARKLRGWMPSAHKIKLNNQKATKTFKPQAIPFTMTLHNKANDSISNNGASPVYSPVYSLLEERGFAAGLEDVDDLTFYADADPPAGEEGISSVVRADGDDRSEEEFASSAPTLRSGGPPQDFEETFDRIDPTAQVPEEQKHLVTPSGATGAFLGLCLGGPIGAALWGFGAAYAVRKDGTVGDMARSLGEVGLTAREKILELDEKHQFAKRTQEAFEESKVASVAADGFNSIADYTRRHQLLERGIENTGRGLEYLVEKISGASPSPEDDYDYRSLNEDFERRNDGTFY
jgi:hypothetical protein